MRLALAIGLGLAILALSPFAAAQEPGGRSVPIVMAGEPAERAALALVIRDLVVRLGINVEISSDKAIDRAAVIDRPPGFARTLAHVWIDLTPSDHALLYIVDSAWERVLIRRVRRYPAHLEVAREELGHILETALEAMLAGARIGLERSGLQRPATPAVAPPPKATRTSRSPVHLRLGVFEQAAIFSDPVPVAHTLGASLSIESSFGLRPGAELSVGYRWPVRTHGPIGVDQEGGEARLLARMVPWSSPDWRFELALGPGLDVMNGRAVANRPGNVTLTPSSADASLLVRFATGFRWKSVLALLVFVDADITGRQYPFEQNGQTVVALAPYLVRPGLLLEATTR